jgi:hypothetical protein
VTFKRSLAPNFFHPGRSSSFHNAPESLSASSTSSNIMVNSIAMLRFVSVSSRSNSGIIVSVGMRSGATGALPPKRRPRNAMGQVEIQVSGSS